MSLLHARVNHVGWVHLWTSRQAFEEGEPSAHFFNGRIDPRWREAYPGFPEEVRRSLESGSLTALEDPGYLGED